MPAKFENLGRVLNGFATVGVELERAVLKAQRRMAEEILNKSQRLVPRTTGNLANSKFIREEFSGGVRHLVLGYSANYAMFVHEWHGNYPARSAAQRRAMFANMRDAGVLRKGRRSNGSPKFLEKPYLEVISTYTERVMRQVRADLRKVKP